MKATHAFLGSFVRAGTDLDGLAATLQRDGAEAFVNSWKRLMGAIETKSKQLK